MSIHWISLPEEERDLVPGPVASTRQCPSVLPFARNRVPAGRSSCCCRRPASLAGKVNGRPGRCAAASVELRNLWADAGELPCAVGTNYAEEATAGGFRKAA